jgi:choice-of-anchor A domain-containing protein
VHQFVIKEDSVKPGSVVLGSVVAGLLAAPASAIIVGPGGGGGTSSGVVCGGTTGLPGAAAPYSVLIVGAGNFVSENTDLRASLAVGGNVTLTSYSVASSVAGDLTAAVNPAALVVGGQLTATYGSVGASGGTISHDGTIYTTTPPILTYFDAKGGTVAEAVLDFNAAATYYTNLSTSLGALAATGTVTQSSSTLTFTGTQTDINIFSVDAPTLAATNNIVVSVPSGSATLINVTGTAATLQNGGVSQTGATPTTVLYNFYQATSLTLPGSMNPQGSLLAPFAAVTGGYGQVSGQLVAASYNANLEFEADLFTCTLPGS